MATLFHPMFNHFHAHIPDHLREFPWWALFEDDEPRRPCSAMAREPQPSTSRAANRCGAGHRRRSPEDFIAKAAGIAGAYLPQVLEVIHNAGNAAAGNDEAKQVKEFVNAFCPGLFETLTGNTVAKPKNAFEVKFNVSNFAPNELSVKTVDNAILIEGKHEEKKDEHGFVSRSFSRRFTIPEGVKPEAVECQLTSDGFLVLSAAAPEPVKNEREIPINFIAAPAQAVTNATNNVEDKEPETAPEVAVAVDAEKPSAPESIDSEKPVVVEDIGNEEDKMNLD